MNMQHEMAEDEGADEAVDDLSTLAWVHEELRRSLETAHKSLRRHLKDAAAVSGSDVDAVDPAVLRSARAQLHQGVGALEMIGLIGPARVLRASESAVQRFIARPKTLNAKAIEAIESASFGVLDYLSRKLAGKGLPTLALFPQYRALQELVGADRVHPADLWRDEWQWRDISAPVGVAPLAADLAARAAMEGSVLAIMRGDDRAAMSRLSDLCAGLGAAAEGRLAGLWHLAAAFYDAQAAGLLTPDVYAKRVSSRLLALLRMSIAGTPEISDRLAQDLLFFCANARSLADPRAALRLQAVREAYQLDDAAAFDYQALRLGRFDPAWIAQARKRVAGAKDAWSAVAGGEAHRMSGMVEQFTLVGDSLRRLYPSGEELADALLAAVRQTVAAEQTPSPALAMEVATSVLYLDASLEDGEFDHPLVGARVQRLAQRIQRVAEGQEAQPLEPWMEELYRRVSDRQTMGSVVHELRATLSEVEKQIDRYFRDPAQRELLIPVPSQLQAMRGVLSVLDMEHASQAVLRMRDDVDALAAAEADVDHSAHTGAFTRLADNLGALSFMIDMLSVQPQMARSLFSFDAATGNLTAVMGRRSARVTGFGGFDEPDRKVPLPLVDQAHSLAQAASRTEVPDAQLQAELHRLSQQALLADQRVLAETMVSAQAALQRATDDEQRQAARDELAQAVAGLAVPSPAQPPALPPQPVRSTPEPLAEVQGSTGLEDDAEMREIFIDEAREVLQEARQGLQRLALAPDDLGDLTLIRRAFHTLKGSSRMVGLQDFGEAAWACEQLYNARLAECAHLEDDLQTFTRQAVADLDGWVEAIAQGHAPAAEASTLAQRADALRTGPAAAAPELPSAAAAAEAELLERVPHLPSAADLSFDFDLSLDDADTVAPADAIGALPVEPAPALGLDFAAASPDQAASAEPFLLDLGKALDRGDAAATEDLKLDPSLGWHDSATDAQLSAAQFDAAFGAAAKSAEPADFLDTHVEAAAAKTAPGEFELRIPAPLQLDLPGPVQAAAADSPPADDEQVKVIGDLRIGIPLFNIYLNEADELSRRLCTELSEWAMEPEQLLSESTAALAHSLAGSSATVGYAELSALARSLEHALMRSIAIGKATPGEPQLFNDAAEEIRRLLHQFAAGFLHRVSAPLMKRLEQHELDLAASATQGEVALPAEAPQPAASASTETESEADLRLQPPATLEPGLADAADAIEFTRPAEAAEAAPPAEAAEAPSPLALPELGQAALTPFSALAEPPMPKLRARQDALDDEDDIDAVDLVDEELFPIFREESEDLLPQLQSHMRDWARRPSELSAAAACMRTLHTFKGGARLAGAMRLGEMAHRLETAIEHLLARGQPATADVELLVARVDAISNSFEQFGQPADAEAPESIDAVTPHAVATEEPALSAAEAVAVSRGEPELGVEAAAAEPSLRASARAAHPLAPLDAAVSGIDWGRFKTGTVAPVLASDKPVASQAAVRVRAPLLDRLVNQAGEVSITRARIESDVGQIKGSLGDLTENLERLRRQLRDLELQAESQIASRMEAAKAASKEFDPLEMDRFTRFQELTRMMAESVNDVATVQRGLQRSLQATEDELAAQARLTRDLQDDLLRTRMVEFESMADRLYRVVRQAAKECGKQVRLDIVGGSIEVDRGVLERMTGPFEHLLRNAVAHGIEAPEARETAGKEAAGIITVSVAQEGNEVAVEFRDDGAGLNLARIRERALSQRLLQGDVQVSDADLANMIFMPGFSTADTVSELAGRGVGMDVVRAEVNAMGGRIETSTAAGQGAVFRLVLPLTTAVTQVVMLRCGELSIAVPSTLIEMVKRVDAEEVEKGYASGAFTLGERVLPFFWLGALLQSSSRGSALGRSQPVVVVRSAAQRVALHVDEVLGNQEVVVKNLGPQLSRLPGLAGITLLPSGTVALIYNPVALATLYGEAAREQLRQRAGAAGPEAPAAAEGRAPMVLVVDDSLTVRRVTQRLLTREGYRVVLAKDGLDALDKLGDELPAVVLSDIEMPRMDGFDLVRNMRSDPRLAGLPVIMITSRIAQKHRDYAAELGVNHYLGKPYSEEELLSLVGRYVQEAAAH